MAIGAHQNDGTGADAGHVRIYDYDGFSWVKVGDDIDGEAAGDRSGFSVSLSSDGSKIAIGAPYNKSRYNRTNAGHTRIYSLPVDSYKYAWDVDSGGAPSDGTYRATVAGADLAGNAYSGTDSITFTLDTSAPTIQSDLFFCYGSYNQGDTVTLYLVADETYLSITGRTNVVHRQSVLTLRVRLAILQEAEPAVLLLPILLALVKIHQI